ncbi:hypothetical protein WL93_23580 [Burkholderia diffusa]|uniref:hypothetical protein n=1 Tax=Burkholderia diffusa TaxID=488732 RepID=UPI00075CA261|nr:hypothetical protein [Burkholderia diffusa]KUZ17131.1 hypothetical protein WI28_05570 [Burkholderia diffusa]KVC17232.1 hypothetical protein WI69_17485 [Burkholderia diffusa]KVC44710.1 hypothetical protein WI71_16450 [Burkholderia diffusa]KVM99037.1 hypothetical protein WJ62_17930 [Burkholderia diffusa]KWF82349.1 hypothetical protein WL93_23580 [Burkholderia diffusa]
MSFATMLVRWLAGRLSGATVPPNPLHAAAGHAVPRRPLRWRAPWLGWQLLSWCVLTLLAPPIWMIGTLLLINASSDQPLFWTLAMAIVPVANGVAIVATNQRHHRVPFTRRSTVALFMFFVAMAIGCTLFVLLLWRSHSIAALVGPLAVDGDDARPAMLAFWVAGLAAMFGVTSSAHASIAHAWLAFEA